MIPDKIYLNIPKGQSDADVATWDTKEFDDCKNIKYIRKDYLLKLTEKHYEKLQNTMQEWNGSMFQSSKMLECFANFIDKLNEI